MTSPDNFVPGSINTGWNDMGDLAEQLGSQGLIGLLFGGFANILDAIFGTVTNDYVAEMPVVMTAADEAAAAAALAAANEEANVANAFAIAEANLKIGTKVDPESVPTDVPGWVTLNPVEDATFPRADLVPIPTIVNVNTTSDDGQYGYHTHKHNATITWADPVYTTALNRLDIGYINATRARIYNTVGVVIAAGATAGLASFRVHIFKMGKDSNGRPDGNLTRLWSSAALEATFGSAAQDVRVEVGTDIIAAKGEWFAVVVHQTSTGTPRNLLGKNTASIAAMSGVYPTRLGMNKSSVTSIPSTLTPAELDTSSTWIPWVCLGQTAGLIKISLVDLFDRADAATLGSNWAVYGVGMDIVSGYARCKPINHGNFTARVEDHAPAVSVSQLSTDAQASSVKITAFDRSHADTEDNPRSQVAVRSNADASRRVTAGIRWGLIEIRAYSAANPDGVTKNSTTYTWSGGEIVELRVSDDGSGVSTYIVYVGATEAALSPVLSWPDLSSETSRGAAFRRPGFETAHTHRGAIIGRLSIPSVGVNEWKARDL
ncbi:hypothetical protein ACFYVR_16085 [Rhodococcus sp. NPDC003318]|uniref:DUF7257 domain-containing protein n=1 Tax=Rhodococcus sp. NPDC003318 TaxID=3364503 RepID=UPI0036AFCF28